MSATDEREFLLQSLRDLEEQYAAGELEEDDYRSLKDDYTARAAALLRADGSAPEVVATAGRRRRGRIVAAVVALACVSGGAGYAVAQASGERLAGDEASGDLPEGSVDRITKANALAADGDILEAIKVYDDLLEDDPENPVALAQRGWLLSRVDASLVDRGLANVERAIAIEPDYAEAHFFRGMILWRAKKDPAAGAESLQRAIDLKPPPDFLPIIEQQRDAAAAEAAGASATP